MKINDCFLPVIYWGICCPRSQRVKGNEFSRKLTGVEVWRFRSRPKCPADFHPVKKEISRVGESSEGNFVSEYIPGRISGEIPRESEE